MGFQGKGDPGEPPAALFGPQIRHRLSTEDWRLSMARRAYMDGTITVDEFENCVEHVLAGGSLSADGRLGGLMGFCLHRMAVVDDDGHQMCMHCGWRSVRRRVPFDLTH